MSHNAQRRKLIYMSGCSRQKRGYWRMIEGVYSVPLDQFDGLTLGIPDNLKVPYTKRARPGRKHGF